MSSLSQVARHRLFRSPRPSKAFRPATLESIRLRFPQHYELLLAVSSGESYAGMSKRFNLPRGTLSSRIQRARQDVEDAGL